MRVLLAYSRCKRRRKAVTETEWTGAYRPNLRLPSSRKINITFVQLTAVTSLTNKE